MQNDTIWEIGGLKLPLDLEDADTVERYEAAVESLERNFPKDRSGSTSEYIRSCCSAYRQMFDQLFGEGTAEKLFAGVPDNLRRYTAVYGELLSFVAKQAAKSQAELQQLSRKYLPGGKA